MNDSAARYFHPSNLLTYLAVLCGLGALLASLWLKSWPLAGGLIALCALADTFDGNFARRFARRAEQRDFGIQLDSLADALNFGLVPVTCLGALLSFASAAMSVTWAAAALAYVISAITRLGAYNLQREQSSDFIGVPTTVAGLIWSTAFLAQPSAVLSALLLALLSLAMVSPLRISRPAGLAMAVFVAWPLVLLVLHAGWWAISVL